LVVVLQEDIRYHLGTDLLKVQLKTHPIIFD